MRICLELLISFLVGYIAASVVIMWLVQWL